jgi:hypothetical protein
LGRYGCNGRNQSQKQNLTREARSHGDTEKIIEVNIKNLTTKDTEEILEDTKKDELERLEVAGIAINGPSVRIAKTPIADCATPVGVRVPF